MNDAARSIISDYSSDEFFHGSWDSETGQTTEQAYVFCYVGGKQKFARTVANVKPVSVAKAAYKHAPKKLRSYMLKCCYYMEDDWFSGAYGWLGGLCDMCWAFNSHVKLYPYEVKAAKKHKSFTGTQFYMDYYFDWEVGLHVTGSPASCIACRYAIEQYLLYAKSHRPKAYRAFMKDKKFRMILKRLDKQISQNVKKYDKLWATWFEKEHAADNAADYNESLKEFKSDANVQMWNRFAKELNKSKYVNLQKKLGLTSVQQRQPWSGLQERPADQSA